jgi:hypothetical protein
VIRNSFVSMAGILFAEDRINLANRTVIRRDGFAGGAKP